MNDEAENSEAVIGHNSGVSTPIAQDELRSLVERIENCEEEKQRWADDMKEVYAEAKHKGFDTKVLRKVIRERKRERQEREEEASIMSLYMHALGMEIFL